MPFPKIWAKPAAAAFALAFAAALCAQRMTTMLPGTVKNFELPNFNENTGAKEWELFGEKASYKSDTRIDVESFKLLLFEDGARGALREQMDVAVARAVAPLNVLAEYLLPYVRVGGRMLCWKGPAVREEMAAGERACKMLGGQAEGLYRLPIEGREHYVHSAIKISATARRYPRKSGTPSKDPLGILPQKP